MKFYNKIRHSLLRSLEKGQTEYMKSKTTVGKGCALRGRLNVHSPKNIKLGAKVSINVGVTMLAQGGIEIGYNTMIAPGVYS